MTRTAIRRFLRRTIGVYYRASSTAYQLLVRATALGLFHADRVSDELRRTLARFRSDVADRRLLVALLHQPEPAAFTDAEIEAIRAEVLAMEAVERANVGVQWRDSYDDMFDVDPLWCEACNEVHDDTVDEIGDIDPVDINADTFPVTSYFPRGDDQ